MHARTKISKAGSQSLLGTRQNSLLVHPVMAAPTSRITSQVAMDQPSMQPKAIEEKTKKRASGQKAEMTFSFTTDARPWNQAMRREKRFSAPTVDEFLF